MLWVAGGIFVLGLACGTLFRLPFFVAVLVVAAAVIVTSDLARGAPTVVLDTILGLIALQVGYGFGIGARALVYARRRRRETLMHNRAAYGSVATRRERH
ncbi:MAG: hypothetical protein JO058_23185 [Alphaproteobacteria bacterium]|nr:hypothetical protein [Alphaproteobacteria bacterium]MBV9151140.1 hypothetical protein [Alphaproteobacteria bacterium]MBV9964607.1 hypothetical protein [Alphaproteobacteria bacterium]